MSKDWSLENRLNMIARLCDVDRPRETTTPRLLERIRFLAVMSDDFLEVNRQHYTDVLPKTD